MDAENVAKLEGNEGIKSFILGGRAIFTLRNEVTGNRRTYSVYRVKDPNKDMYFVNVRGDGESTQKDKEGRHKWVYVGTIWNSQKSNSKFTLTAKSRVDKTSLAFLGFSWLWQKLVKSEPLHKDMSIYHEGRCARCGRQLTDPDSIQRGFGPECYKKAV